ncbi:Cytochrome P450 [Macrophomina phaseolina MS6]|uniref:Cytochrome P450 n=1 Tax=Macrophomina phaseolina (strain MS6) TaxID=1126212 RepID=K2QK31_MACPH|nr:Cytochrome P450 [Macrophomina phaseolina MS6]
MTNWIFLSSSKHIRNLLEKRAAIYCSRPAFPFANDIMSDGCRMVLMAYNDRWRTLRKIMHNILSTRQRDTYKPYQDLESRHLLYDYLHNHTRWFSANARYSNSVIMTAVFGKRMDLDNPQTDDLLESIEMFAKHSQPGTHLVDSFPILAKLPRPLQWWRSEAEKNLRFTLDIYRREVVEIKERMAAGALKDCFAKEFLESKEALEFSESQRLFTLGTLMEAGTDTSRLSLNNILAAAAAYPDWPVRAREQLDALCGDAERLPGWEDRDALPFITAAVKEGFRWRPKIADIGVPVTSIRDDEYEGYRIPAGTVVTWSNWAVAMNPNEYEDPERFWPERFMNEDLKNPLKGQWGFGPGKRTSSLYQPDLCLPPTGIHFDVTDMSQAAEFV